MRRGVGCCMVDSTVDESEQSVHTEHVSEEKECISIGTTLKDMDVQTGYK